MTIELDPKLEQRVRERAAAEGLTVPQFIEALLSADLTETELYPLALEGLNSGEPFVRYGPDMRRSASTRLLSPFHATAADSFR